MTCPSCSLSWHLRSATSITTSARACLQQPPPSAIIFFLCFSLSLPLRRKWKRILSHRVVHSRYTPPPFPSHVEVFGHQRGQYIGSVHGVLYLFAEGIHLSCFLPLGVEN